MALSSIFRVRTPGAAGAEGWQPLGHGWRAYTLGPDVDPWEHSMGSERTRGARRGFSVLFWNTESIPCTAGSCWGMAVIGETS